MLAGCNSYNPELITGKVAGIALSDTFRVGHGFCIVASAASAAIPGRTSRPGGNAFCAAVKLMDAGTQCVRNVFAVHDGGGMYGFGVAVEVSALEASCEF